MDRNKIINKLNILESELNEIKKNILNDNKIYNIDADKYLLLVSQKYRIETAINMCNSNKEISNLLKISERHVYRLRKKYEI